MASGMLNSLLGLCGASVDEKAELQPKVKESESTRPTPWAMVDSLSSRVMSLAGREAPDPEFDSAKKLLAEPALLSVAQGGGAPAEMARFATSSDGSMLTWQSLALQSNMPKFSGAISLASITRVERPPVGGGVTSWLGRAQTPTIAIHHSSPSEQLRVEASSEVQRDEYAAALDRVSTKLRAKHAEVKSQGKLARHATKELEMMSKRQNAEKRKSEIMQSMQNSGGMKHTAMAMASRS